MFINTLDKKRVYHLGIENVNNIFLLPFNIFDVNRVGNSLSICVVENELPARLLRGRCSRAAFGLRAAALKNPAWGLCPQTPTNFLKKV